MAYMRGSQYLWSDGERLHLWARDGYDGWDESTWAEGSAGAEDASSAAAASGTALAQEIADEYVVMRLAELVGEGGVAASIARALAKHSGNSGCTALAERAAMLTRTLEVDSSAPPAP